MLKLFMAVKNRYFHGLCECERLLPLTAALIKRWLTTTEQLRAANQNPQSTDSSITRNTQLNLSNINQEQNKPHFLHKAFFIQQHKPICSPSRLCRNSRWKSKRGTDQEQHLIMSFLLLLLHPTRLTVTAAHYGSWTTLWSPFDSMPLSLTGKVRKQEMMENGRKWQKTNLNFLFCSMCMHISSTHFFFK